MATTQAPEGWLEDYFVEGSSAQGKKEIGVIFVHGFTGSPASMRPWAHYFQERGYTVSVPRLPGHGRTWQELNSVAWEQWPARVQEEVDRLSKSCTKVFIFGLSMGGATTINVAERNSVAGLVLVNPMIHIPGITIKFAPIIAVLKAGMPSVGDDIKAPGVTEWGYDALPTKGVLQLNAMLKQTRKNLQDAKSPLLLFHSTEDHVLPVSNTEIIMNEIGSTPKERIELTNSYHVATLDNDAPEIFEKSLAFVESWS